MIPAGFEIDSGSDSKRSVFVNHKTKEVVIAHRGTVPTDTKDIVADLAIMANVSSSTSRFQKAISKDKKVKDKYKPLGYSIVVVGVEPVGFASLADSLDVQGGITCDIKCIVSN